MPTAGVGIRQVYANLQRHLGVNNVRRKCDFDATAYFIDDLRPSSGKVVFDHIIYAGAQLGSDEIGRVYHRVYYGVSY